ncbi:Hypothetical predicted protein [Octopus vulgaris]|uniref:Uncharacterized protein n=1 Tax=Octopus vulgaris TaxID=6645 RepID=A0AA36EW43_OCTVU|nr:Hypothetical predicted protein [Octopus vulgaris]
MIMKAMFSVYKQAGNDIGKPSVNYCHHNLTQSNMFDWPYKHTSDISSVYDLTLTISKYLSLLIALVICRPSVTDNIFLKLQRLITGL